jgi:hydrogenase-4 component B
MVKQLIEIFNLVAILAIVCIPFLSTKARGILTATVISVQVVICSMAAIAVFSHGSIEYFYQGSFITGAIPIRVDYLSAWFILVISFTFLTGVWYGLQYMKKYAAQTDNIALHIIAFILVFTSLIDICLVQNSLLFLVAWEIMALSSFLLVIFENYKADVIKAGIYFLVMSHICIMFLTLAFIWIKIQTGSFDFVAITTFTSTRPAIVGVGLFIIFFVGFAIKAGFVPFHTWLPLAHPAAPSHISGIMSGVIIKIGIYGILRMLLLIKSDYTTLGYFILIVSVITGVYGVMLAIIQHNLKKLLAYHSIENIGIIGIGIGMGCLGLGYENQMLVVTGFGGALLHVLNHSLFKSLLFFTAGNVYQAAHTMNIESLGGLLKKIPNTAYLFLLGSLAICGLPPFNGFVSEYFIYVGMFKGLSTSSFSAISILTFSILGMVIIGGLALICFTKAFGTVFLGHRREVNINDDYSEPISKSLPLYAVGILIVLVGIIPFVLNPVLYKIIGMFGVGFTVLNISGISLLLNDTTIIGWYSLGFVLLGLSIYYIRKIVSFNRSASQYETWGCGYTGNPNKMQYTASSFIRTYRKLAEPLLMVKKDKKYAKGLYPDMIKHETHPEDLIEYILTNKPNRYSRQFFNRFAFLQNGRIQAYILYGFIFIGLIIIVPLVVEKFSTIINFLKLM